MKMFFLFTTLSISVFSQNVEYKKDSLIKINLTYGYQKTKQSVIYMGIDSNSEIKIPFQYIVNLEKNIAKIKIKKFKKAVKTFSLETMNLYYMGEIKRKRFFGLLAAENSSGKEYKFHYFLFKLNKRNKCTFMSENVKQEFSVNHLKKIYNQHY